MNDSIRWSLIVFILKLLDCNETE